MFQKIIAISDNVAASLRESGVNSDQIVTIRSAVETKSESCLISRQEWLREFNLLEQDVVAVIVAQFIDRKGQRYLLQALPDLCAAHPNFRLILFGEGPTGKGLREQVAQLGVGDHVQFAGFRDDIDRLLGHADMLIHPALHEGLGVSMLKAAAAGLPVVAFDVAGAKEAVIPNETGLLVKASDVRALLHAVTHLVENPSERRSLGAAGKVRMRESFSIDRMTGKHIELYESTVNEF